jgi:hypothetical protein
MGETNRASGRTTQLIDKAIQDLFTSGKAEIKDHVYNYEATRMLAVRVLARLKYEHPSAYKHVEKTEVRGWITLTLDI